MKEMFLNCKSKVRERWIPILGVEVIFLFCISYYILPVYHWIIEKVFYLNGFMYITDSNVKIVIKNPGVIITVLILLLLSGFLFLFEKITILLIVGTGQFHWKYWRASLKKMISLPGVIFGVLSFFTSLVFHPFYLIMLVQNFRIVELIKERIFAGRYSNFTITMLAIFIFFVGFFFLFLEFEYFIAHHSMKTSIKNTMERMKEYARPVTANMIIFHLLTLIVFMLFYLAFMFLFFIILNHFQRYSLRYGQWLTLMDIVNRSMLYFYSIIALVINFIVVTVASSYAYQPSEFFLEIVQKGRTKGHRTRKRIIYAYLLLQSIFIFYIVSNKDFLMGVRLRIGYETGLEQPEVVAHRGNSSMAPENTLVSVQSAIDAQADRTEIDVQMSKDKVLVLMHDQTLNRTCNKNGRIVDYSYNQLEKMDAGSWFSTRFAKEPIPSLSDVFELSKNKINLLIELKEYTGREEEYAKAVDQLVDEYDMKQNVIIACFSIDMLEELKKLDKGIVTCLISRVAYGPLYENKAIDTISITSGFAGSKTIQTYDNLGYSLYIWTVNDRRSILNMKDSNVSGIITDYPIKARELLYEDSVPDFIGQLIDNLFLVL